MKGGGGSASRERRSTSRGGGLGRHPPPQSDTMDTVNEQVGRILMECIKVVNDDFDVNKSARYNQVLVLTNSL